MLFQNKKKKKIQNYFIIDFFSWEYLNLYTDIEPEILFHIKLNPEVISEVVPEDGPERKRANLLQYSAEHELDLWVNQQTAGSQGNRGMETERNWAAPSFVWSCWEEFVEWKAQVTSWDAGK